MTTIWQPAFWRDASTRAIKTCAQTAVGVVTSGAVGLLDVDWVGVASASGLAGVVSILMSVASSDGPDANT
ncbi:holin [Nocardioides sp. WV_118_6]